MSDILLPAGDPVGRLHPVAAAARGPVRPQSERLAVFTAAQQAGVARPVPETHGRPHPAATQRRHEELRCTPAHADLAGI